MKRKSISIYSVLISLAFLSAIIYFAVAMTIEYKNGNYRAEQLFSMLCKNVENSADGFPSMNLIEENGNFAAVTLFRNRKCIFSYPNEDAQNMESTQFIKVSKRTIKKGNNTLELAAAIYILRPLSIFRYGKIAFVVILIATLFTIGLIIYYSIKDSNEPEEIDEEAVTEKNAHSETPRGINAGIHNNETEKASESVNNNEQSEDEAERENSDNSGENFENSDNEIHINNEAKAYQESEASIESEEQQKSNDEKDKGENSEKSDANTPENAYQNPNENSNQEYDEKQNADFNKNSLNATENKTQNNTEVEAQNEGGIQEQTEQDTANEQSTQNKTEALEESNESNQDEQHINDALVAASETSNNEAQAIFSVETGFCLQSQLQTRLDAELVRCGASELDLSLFIVKITGSEISKENAKKIGECLLGRIQFRDCIFEHGENSFAIMIPEIEIEQAEDFAEELFNDISKIIDDTDADCFIGISSRTMRVISASRLINEAEEALEHAVKDGKSKIIGFHVDIEKYRQFIKDTAE